MAEVEAKGLRSPDEATAGPPSPAPASGDAPRSRSLVRLIALVLLIATGIVIARRTPLGAYLTRDGVFAVIDWLGAHPWAPLIFVGLYAAATALAVPGTVLTLAGGAIFGFWWGTALNWAAANIGANAAFLIARSLGRDGVRRLGGGDSSAFARMERIVRDHGMQGLLTLRLIPLVPFNALNFGSGLLPLRWRTYAVATCIGIVPGTAIYTYFADALLQGSQEASGAAFMRVLVAGALLAGLSFLPALLKRLGVRLPGMGARAVLLLLASALAGTAEASAQNGRPADRAQRPDVVRAEPLVNHDPFTQVLSAVAGEGGVDYQRLADDPAGLHNYIATLGVVKASAVAAASPDEQLAFWINAYNACMLKRVIDHYPIQPARGLLRIANAAAGRPANSVWQIEGPFTAPHCAVAESERSQDEIEHEIIRPMGDPRIHFAINCAARSCPPLIPAAYEAATLDAQLDDRVRAFLADPAHFSVTRDGGRRAVVVNTVLDWFKEDFGGDEGIRRFLAEYASAADAAALTDPATRLEFAPYDWRLNDSRF